VPRYVYRVVVDMVLDDQLLVRAEPVQIEDRVPFRGRTVMVERIEDTDEARRLAWRFSRGPRG
jgi:hypothetical protein